MFENIAIKYYNQKEISKHFMIKDEYSILANFVKRLIREKRLSYDVCYPYDLFYYTCLKKRKPDLDNIVLVLAIKDSKVIGICIFEVLKKMIHVHVFCIDQIVRGIGFSKYFLGKCFDIIYSMYEMPLLLVSTEEGKNLYEKHGFKEIEYKRIKKLDRFGHLSWVNPKENYIGKYLMLKDVK